LKRSVHEFVMRGVLTEEALDRAGRRSRNGLTQEKLVDALNYDLLDPDELEVGREMGAVYAAITAFERSSRRFITKVLQGEHGEGWWDTKVSKNVRERAESRRLEEDKIKWHGTRGDDPLTYTEMGDLVKIIQQNRDDFEPHLRSIEWAAQLFESVERSRNVIMHSGTLDQEDVERLGMSLRDWTKQVGT
jgi:hypothetical protein